jgi:hypothetical protein
VEPVRRLLRVRMMSMAADAEAADGRADRSIMWAYAWARGHSSERLPTPPSSARSPVCCRAPGWSRGGLTLSEQGHDSGVAAAAGGIGAPRRTVMALVDFDIASDMAESDGAAPRPHAVALQR